MRNLAVVSKQNSRHFRNKSVSGSVGLMLLHKSRSYLTAKLANFTVQKQRAVIFFCGQNVVKRMNFIRDCQRNVANKKRRCLLSKGVVLFHDNARPNSAASTAETSRQLKFELIPQSPYHQNLVKWVNTCYGPLK